VGNQFYAYATNAFGKHVQVARSDDLVQWELLPDALPALPAWVDLSNSQVWAPAAIQIGNQFILYYTARDQQSQRQCVGVATSTRPDGGFLDTRPQPLICQAEQGGTIDPRPFRDGDTLYLYYKNDGNCCGLPTHLYGQALAPDGLSLMGASVPLLVNDLSWEGNVIEAPEMFQHDGNYYLFYSANDYGGASYAVGYARCHTALGPCRKAPENPILSSRLNLSPPVIGPGGQHVFQVGGQTWIVYHAWNTTDDGQQGDSRLMWLDRITWQQGKPVIQGPTTEPQPIP
jgi:beta-xylosidase